MDNFYKFIWSKYTAPMIPSFGEKYLEGAGSIEYLMLLFQGYVRYTARLYGKLASIHCAMLQQYIEEVLNQGLETQNFDTDSIENDLQLDKLHTVNTEEGSK
jgi:hypothetical protein